MAATSSPIERLLLRPVACGLHRAHRFAVRHPVLPAAGATLVLVAVLPLVGRMPVALSVRDAVDPRSRAIAEIHRSESSFGEEHSFLLLLRPVPPGAGFDPARSAAIEDWIESLSGRAQIQRVTSPLDLQRLTGPADAPATAPRLDDLSASSLQTLRDSPWQGLLTDHSCRDVAVEIALRPQPGRYGPYDPGTVDAIVQDARLHLEERAGGIAVHATGVGAFEAETARGIRRFRWLNLAVVGLLLGLTRLALGTWRAGVLLLLPVVVASAVVYGGMYLRGDPIDMLSTGLFLLLAVAAIEDFYFLSLLRSRSGDRWRSPFRRLLLPGLLTSLTTVLGFGSLLAADLALVRRLGLWAATGAVVEWAATFLVLPAVLALVPAARSWTDPSRARGVATLERLARARWPRPVALASLVVLAAGVVGAFHLDFRDSPDRTFPPSSRYGAASRELRESRGWSGSIWVVAPSRADDALDDYEEEWVALEDVLRLLRGWPEVAAVLDPGAALEDLDGDRRTGLQQLARMDPGGHELDPAGFAAPDGSLRARVFLRDVDLEGVSAVRDLVRGLGERNGVYPAGELVAWSEFAESVPRALLRSLVTCLVLVGGVVALVAHARGGTPVPAVLAATAWGPALTLALVAGLSVPVNFLTCVFAGVLVGLTGDNALQYLFAGRSTTIVTGAGERGAASIRIAGLMSACALVFLGSAFVASRQLGLLLATGLLASLVGDLWILRSLPDNRSRP